MNTRKLCYWCSAVMMVQFAITQAQTVMGTLTGIVTDPADAVVTEATIKAVDQATGVVTQTRSTGAGVYTLSLRPGIYEISVAQTGFRTLVRQAVEVNIGQTSRLDLKLQVGDVSEKLTIEASAPLISTDTSELGAVVRSQTVLDLPLSTPGQRRMADTFTLLVPGVTTGAGSGGTYANLQWDRGGQWQVNGSQENSREILYDGISIGEIHSPGRFWAGSPPPDSIQEFKMLTGSYSAEYGRSTGGIITLTTRSGGNEFHGSAYNFFRNEAMHARGFFAPLKQKDRQNEFGVTFGGPVHIPRVYDGRNRTFFYVFYNGLRWRTSSANELITVPRPEFLSGDFSGFLDPQGRQRVIYDPLTSHRLPSGDIERDAFPGNRIPNSRISPISQRIAALLPRPTMPGQARNMVGVRRTISDDDRWQVKLDHVLNEKHRLSGLYSPGKFVRDGSGPLEDRIFSGFTTRDERAHLVRVAHDWILGPTLVNRFSVGFNRDAPFTGSPTVGEGWPAQLGIRGTGDDTGGAFPRISFGSEIDDGAALGGEANSYQAENSFIFSDVLTKVFGRHSVRVGGDYRRYQLNARVFHRTHGTFNFGSGFTSNPASPNRVNTGSGVATFLLGAVQGGTVLYPTTSVGNRFTYGSAFFQDDIKLTRRLTLNLGLRWEVVAPLREVADRLTYFDPSAPNPRAGNRPGALAFTGSGPGRTGSGLPVDTDYNNWGPRAGLAFRVTDRTVLRTGYGIFYGLGGAGVENALGTRMQLGYNAQPTFAVLDPSGLTPAFYWDNGLPPVNPAPPVLDPSFANLQNIGSWVRSEDGRPPYVQNWHFGIQRQVTDNLMVDVAYVGSKGTRLTSSNMRINQLHPDLMHLGLALTLDVNSQTARDAGFAPPYPGFTGTVAQALRPFPQYLDITAPMETLGHSTYNALQMFVQQRLSHGLNFSVAYTFSKKLTNAGESQVFEQNAGPMDYYNLSLDKSLSYNDLRHVVAIGYSYELPIGSGKALLNVDTPVVRQLISGWQISGMNRYQSGPPLRISGAQSTGIFSGNRPTYVQGQNIRTDVSAGNFDPGVHRWLNVNAFSTGERFRFGDVPRTIHERGFPFFDESFSLLKKTRVAERVQFEFRVEFYNVFNRVNFAPPVTSITSPTFGQVTSQLGNPRQAQLGLRISF